MIGTMKRCVSLYMSVSAYAPTSIFADRIGWNVLVELLVTCLVHRTKIYLLHYKLKVSYYKV